MKNKDNRSDNAVPSADTTNQAETGSPRLSSMQMGQTLRRLAEDIVREKGALSLEALKVLSPEEIQHMLYELRVHQVELEIENEELARSKAEFEASKERFFDFYDLAPVGYCTINEEGLIIDANLTLANQLGVARGALIKQPISRFIFEEDQDICHRHHKQLFEADAASSGQAGIPQVCELRMVKNDGTIFWVHLTATIVQYPLAGLGQDTDGSFVCRVVLTDLTESKKAEKALVESEKLYRSLFENMMNGFAYCRMLFENGIPRDFIYLAVNDAFEWHTGLKDVVGKKVTEIIPGIRETDQKIFEIYSQVALTGEPTRFEMFVESLQMWFSISVYSPEYEHFVAVFDVVTERKRAEAQLKDRNKFLENITKISPDIIYLYDIKKKHYSYINKDLASLLGYTPKEILIASDDLILKCIYPDDLPTVTKHTETLSHTQSNDTFQLEYRIKGKNGECLWFYVREQVYQRDHTGHPEILFGIVQDITERKRAEEELRKSEGHLRTLVQTIPDLIWLKDKDGIFLSCNPIFERLLGSRETDIIGKTDYSFVDQDLADFFVENDRKAMKAGKPTSNEEWVTFADDGHRVLLETIKTPMYDNRGTLIGVLGIGRDITERKKAEVERANLQDQLIHAQKMDSIGRLAGGVAHDYNNMLNIIVGYSELALEKLGPTDPLNEDISEIHKAAIRSTDITRQLLAFARKQNIAPVALDLNDSVEDTLKMLRRLIGEDVDLAWLPETGLWPVKMDPSQLNQILANLCVNARDAINGVGRITIETHTATFDTAYCLDHPGFVPGEFVLLAVSDDGCGMDSDTVDKIFEPFFTTKAVGQGTGLGLATVHGIIKQNNGFINVYSEPGKGTTFKIYLARHIDLPVEVPGKAPANVCAGHGETILVVEDEASILKFVKRILEELGYTVLTSNIPSQALRLAGEYQSRIDLLITDVVMPEMNGKELSNQLCEACPGLKTLFMSGYTASAIAHRGVLEEGINFMQKPFSKEIMAVKVREALDG